MKIKDLRRALKRFDDEEEVKAYLSIDHKGSHIDGIHFDVDRWVRNGFTLQFVISQNILEIKRIFKEVFEEHPRLIKENRNNRRAISRPKMNKISFEESCSLLKNDQYFLMIFLGVDDISDTYATILIEKPWIGNELILPLTSQHIAIIEKTSISKNWLISYPKLLNAEQTIDENTWDSLFAVIFDGKDNLHELLVDSDKRIKSVKHFQENYPNIIKRWKEEISQDWLK